jgi:hypothetical protein
MKKLVVSVGIIALGSSVLHAVETGALNAQQTKKAWSVSASLRGFYDDNFNSTSGAAKQSSTGVEISPSVDFGVAGEQSSFDIGYDLTARYYEKAVNGSSDHSDFTHNFNATGTHAFSERFRMNARESFVVGQEPDLLSGGGNIVAPQRISGDNYRNNASVGGNFQATSRLGLGASYNNTIVDYEDDSLLGNSAKLDRMEQGVNLTARWVLSPQTTGLVGVRLGKTDYSRENELIDASAVTVGTNTFIVTTPASVRDSKSQIFYAGLEHEFNSNLTGSLSAGGQRTEFPNDPNKEAKWTPWVEGSLDYQIQSQTKLSGGVSYSRTPTDVIAAQSNGTTNSVDLASDTTTASIYGSISHQIAQHLTGSGTARYQTAKFNGGSSDGRKDNFLLLGLSLAYQFNPNFEGNIGYNFDDLSSDLAGRTYNRNKFYVGVTAKY